jgi:spermidine synthase
MSPAPACNPLHAARECQLRTALFVAAVLSGAATLIYQLAWVRELTIWIGATYPAISVVMASFMLGLGGGAVLGGALADRVARPARTYGLVELAVVGYALLFPMLAAGVGRVELSTGVGPVSWRALVAAVTLLPGTALMGMTFPLLSKALHAEDQARHVPWLYSANTAGAAVGCVLGGLVLPFAVGIPWTVAVAASLNLTAAALAFRGARDVRPAPLETGPRPPRLLLALAFLSGLLVLAAEFFWTRSILQLNHGAFETFVLEPADLITAVVALVLLGSAIGGVLCSRLGDWSTGRAAHGLAWIYAGVAVSSLAILEYPAAVLLDLGRPIAQWPAHVLPVRLALIVGPSILLGLSFPLLARLYAGAWAGHGRRMGLVWMFNSVGAMLGSLLAGWWGLGRVGAGVGLVLCSSLAVCLAAACAILAERPRRRELLTPVLAGSAVVALVAAFVPLGPGQSHRLSTDREVRATWESWEATTVVVADISGKKERLILETNGRMIPNTRRSELMIHHVLQAAAGVRSALVIGFGTGGMAEALLLMPGVERLVIVELDGSQVQAAPWFGTEGLLLDPRVSFVADDALHYLAVSEERFDVLVIDGWGPRLTPTLYTAEFHERALERLTDNGVVAAKMMNLEGASMRKVVDGFRCTYPHSYQAKRPTMLLGSKRPLVGFASVAQADACDPLRHLYPFRLRERRAGREG